MATLYISSKPTKITKNIISFMRKEMPSMAKMKLYITFEVAYPKDSEYYKDKGIYSFPSLEHSENVYTGMDEIIDFFKNQYQKFLNKRNMEKNKSEEDGMRDYWKNVLKENPNDENNEEEGLREKAQRFAQERAKKLKARDPRKGKKGKAATAPAAPSNPSSQLRGESRPANNHAPRKKPERKMSHRTPAARAPRRAPSRRSDFDDAPPRRGRASNMNPSPVDILNDMKGSGEDSIDNQLMANFFANQQETVL